MRGWLARKRVAQMRHNRAATIIQVSIPGDVSLESVDSISRDGPDMPIYVVHYKTLINSSLVFSMLLSHIFMILG